MSCCLLEVLSGGISVGTCCSSKFDEDFQKFNSMMEIFKDVFFVSPGPILDCVVWHDGEKWVAALEKSDMYEAGSGEGLLADFVPMTNFRVGRQYSTFSADNACNFVCNIYNDGNLLSIVVDGGMHGTHVAGIVAANNPDDPDLNGIAPGGKWINPGWDTPMSGTVN